MLTRPLRFHRAQSLSSWHTCKFGAYWKSLLCSIHDDSQLELPKTQGINMSRRSYRYPSCSDGIDCALANPSECRCMATNVNGSCLRRVLRGLDSFRAGNSGSLRTCCMYCHKTTQVSANGLEKLPDSFAILEKELQPVRKQGRRDRVWCSRFRRELV